MTQLAASATASQRGISVSWAVVTEAHTVCSPE
jgi:hypothetical protein